MQQDLSPLLAGALCLLLLSSCGEEEIRTYRVAAEASSPISSETASSPGWRVTWPNLSGWAEGIPGPSPATRFVVDPAGQVSITKLAGDGGGIPANVNRWRGQAGLPALPEAEIVGEPVPLSTGKLSILLFDAQAQAENNPSTTDGILAGILPLDNETWFFKFSAPSQVLAQHRAAFIEFLRGVEASTQSARPAEAVADSSDSESRRPPRIEYTKPAGWEPSRGSAMRAASFSISGTSGKADVAVVPMPGDAGSPLENVNWWRGQLRLAPLEEGDGDALGNTIEGAAGEFFVAYLESDEALLDGDQKAAISAAMLKKGDLTWFFKMTGASATVRENRSKFESFVRSAVIP